MSLESISADLDSLIAAANASTAANLKLVSDNMDVLTRYKEMLERGIVEEATDEKIKLQQPPWSGDKQALAAHKTWLSTVNQLAKSVDKVHPLTPSLSTWRALMNMLPHWLGLWSSPRTLIPL